MARVGEFNAMEVTNTARAFATADLSDSPTFVALARAAERRVSEFTMEDLANTAWVFAAEGQPVPILPDPVRVLELMESQGVKPPVLYYQLSMQYLAMTGQIVAGFVLLRRAR
eukprot:gnl/TRDRNA2_/TRDRNA2_155971_c2_seq1.p2 gnl/TRDRNA2_/TRDRNA2_155971_c2~~gnl/TRDRNA2_/TRDRNA2_155971_c2_seq1.p2  ORF type:complete len:113 (-),score=23.21 gnl/TRDRNA2_/TRDRNA2_155971_c2_seq1:75-413(-)